MNATTEEVINIIAKIAKKSPSEVQPENDLTSDFNMKSMARFELAALLENHFKVKVSNNEIRLSNKVSDVIELIEKKLS